MKTENQNTQSKPATQALPDPAGSRIPLVPKGKRISATRTGGNGYYTHDLGGEHGAWIFHNETSVPWYLRDEAVRGRVFLAPDAEIFR